MEHTCCWCRLWMTYNAMNSKSSKNTQMRKNEARKLCTEKRMRLFRCWHLEKQTYPKVWKSYEVQGILKCADLIRYRWHKSVRILSSKRDTKVCLSYQAQVIQKWADLMRHRSYKTVPNLWGTGDTKVCRSHELGFTQKCADLMRYRR